jgi:hypothetical protein
LVTNKRDNDQNRQGGDVIIALTGFKRTGKNTVTTYLKSNYNFVEYAFANPIKEISHSIFNWKPEDDEALKEVIDPIWGISRREFWQWFGTEAMQYHLPDAFPSYKEKIGRTVWSARFEQKYLEDPTINYAVSDFRFPHEEKLLKKLGACTVKVVNRNIKNMDMHESEMYIDSLKCDFVLINESTIGDLHIQIDKLMQTIYSLKE